MNSEHLEARRLGVPDKSLTLGSPLEHEGGALMGDATSY